MDFNSIKKDCRIWSDESGVQLISVDEEEKRISFLLEDKQKTFYLNAQSTDDLMVWSEDEEVLSQLSDIQDFTGSCKKKTVKEILERTKEILLEDEEFHDSGAESDDMDDDIQDYYNDPDEDMRQALEQASKEESDDDQDDDLMIGGASPGAVQRLLKDWKNFKKEADKFGLGGGPRERNILLWDIQLKDIPESRLGRDLQAYAKRNNTEPQIDMEMVFPIDYPMSPPFVRVVKPRFKFLTGHVTIGGSICMEMLTKSGWRPTNDIENILVQIRCEILSDPNASLDLSNANKAYTEQEAKDAFRRMVQRYKWN